MKYKIVFWKRWLSYLFSIQIESISSPTNERLDVFLSKGRYQLCSKHAIYSFEDKYDNFRDSFEKLKLPENQTNVLILGFGLGSIPIILERTFHKHYQYCGVEIDPIIVELVHKYTLPAISSEISIVVVDAKNFVNNSKDSYDLICIDIFLDDVIPDYYYTHNFLESVQQLLSQNGILLFNHLYGNTRDRDKTDKYFSQVFKPFFPDSYKIITNSNCVLIQDQKYIS